MTEGLREVDDSIGRCAHCEKLIFKDEDWVIPQFSVFAGIASVAHRDCEQKYMNEASQIGNL